MCFVYCFVNLKKLKKCFFLTEKVVHIPIHSCKYCRTIYIPKQLYIQVVVKFLRKSGVLQGSWVKDEDMGLVALEISLLARLSHPNIVMVRESV